MQRTDEDIYRDAIKWLFHNTYGEKEDGEEKIIELFDKLLAKKHRIPIDGITGLCIDAGYTSECSKDIKRIYDILKMRYWHQGNSMIYWSDEMIEKIEQGDIPNC